MTPKTRSHQEAGGEALVQSPELGSTAAAFCEDVREGCGEGESPRSSGTGPSPFLGPTWFSLFCPIPCPQHQSGPRLVRGAEEKGIPAPLLSFSA